MAALEDQLMEARAILGELREVEGRLRTALDNAIAFTGTAHTTTDGVPPHDQPAL